MRPVFWVARLIGMKIIADPEVRTKLSLLTRSRWFRPPFDGMKMAAFMYDAVNAMGAPRTPEASLIPSGQQLFSGPGGAEDLEGRKPETLGFHLQKNGSDAHGFRQLGRLAQLTRRIAVKAAVERGCLAPRCLAPIDAIAG